MTDGKESRRPDAAIAARHAESQRCKERALAALNEAVGEAVRTKSRINLVQVAKDAGVSRAFFYSDLREELSAARLLERQAGSRMRTRRPEADAGIKSDLLLAHEQIASLRQENSDLRRRLSFNVGGQLEVRSAVSADAIAEKQQEVERLLSQKHEDAETVKTLRRTITRLEDRLAAEQAAHAASVKSLTSSISNVTSLQEWDR